MEQKAYYTVEILKNERLYRFMAPLGSPIGESYDACFEMLELFSKMANEAVAKTKENNQKEEDTSSVQ
jgi:hypothetical protein